MKQGGWEFYRARNSTASPESAICDCFKQQKRGDMDEREGQAAAREPEETAENGDGCWYLDVSAAKIGD